MFAVLKHPTYAKLFAAQVLSLIGTGLLTVALGLLTVDIAGSQAGAVLGTAMTIKILAYVFLLPLITTLVGRLPRKAVLIGSDLIRAGIALLLPWVTEAWQIYLLIFLLQSVSAAFTPIFQALIPSVLPDEDDYTNALSLSRLAYDLESLASPALAAFLLTMMSYHSLFMGTVLGFLASATLVGSSRLPAQQIQEAEEPFTRRLTQGVRIFFSQTELKVLLGLNLTVATAIALVIVNTPALVAVSMGRSQSDVALVLGVYGAGSMLVAFCAPGLLKKIKDTTFMLIGGVLVVCFLGLSLLAVSQEGNLATQWILVLLLWFALGIATSMILTPSSRLLRRNSTEDNRASVFAAQFSLSHACYLVTYPIAGFLGAASGFFTCILALALIAGVGLAIALLYSRKTLAS